MNFVDYKCLESLLIEGEEIIATEGLKETLSNAGKKIVEILKNLKNKMIELFSKFIKKIKEVSHIKDVENLKDTRIKQEVALKNAIGDLSACLGYVSKFSSNLSKYEASTYSTSHNPDDDQFKYEAENALHQINHFLEKANDDYEEAFNNQGIKYNKNNMVHELESIKNTFIKEIDIAIKLYNGPTGAIPTKYGSDLCSVNSKFLSIYGKILQLLM